MCPGLKIFPPRFGIRSEQAVDAGSSITSTVYVDMTGMVVSMAVGANPVLVLFSGKFFSSGAFGIYFYLEIDGVLKISTLRSLAGTSEKVGAFNWLETLPAGAHTFKVKWRVSGGTGTVSLPTMQVIELIS